MNDFHIYQCLDYGQNQFIKEENGTNDAQH